ncbi:bifunctional tetrahydrofolate synthase/dihydrofolate synthase [Catenovulum sp. SM1970]|uniref:bifunctional tetrahydrofolate synthase/dihydrofolate synthase n=1 Tax=Marinifaba aquimaris TaxID=2741323 RepID=UPI0015739233|nr:bifunctional tetrahydrofolate synthase/dihydrofolate synthase [Marinifaba aquimaris]
MEPSSVATKPESLQAWLQYLEIIHPANIELGLARVQTVFQRLQLNFSQTKTILVGGTNGKGTTCRLLHDILLAQGFSVSSYNSPHLIDYTERVTVNAKHLSEQAHCEAFTAIEAARLDGDEITLTYFEMGTLAGLYLLAQVQADYTIIEVGLGGRLDATNIIEPDISVITTVDLDHTDWLGDTREKIGYEKAGIFRAEGRAVCGDLNPPKSVLAHAELLGCPISISQIDYSFQELEQSWRFTNSHYFFAELVKPAMPIQNAANVLQVLTELGIDLSEPALNKVFADFTLPGRWQTVANEPEVILDVGHNPQAAGYLAKQLNALLAANPDAKIYAVVGMLQDKNMAATLEQLSGIFEHWYIASIEGPRGTDSKESIHTVPNNEPASACCSIVDAFNQALSQAQQSDVVFAFGSFYVIADVMSALDIKLT